MRTELSVGAAAGLATVLALVGSGAALAVPVDCTNSLCEVTDGGWTIAADPSEKDLVLFEFDGVNHIDEEEFHLGFGAGIPSGEGDQDISSTLDKQSASADEATNTIVSVFTGECVQATVTRKLTASGGSALLEESLALSHLCSEGSLEMWVIEWSDFNLSETPDDDTGSYNPATRTFHLSDPLTTASVKSLQPPDSFDIADCHGDCESTILDDRPSGGLLAGSTGPVGPDDLTNAFHFAAVIVGEGSLVFSFEKRIGALAEPPEIPALGPTGFVALASLLAGIAVLALARRRRPARNR